MWVMMCFKSNLGWVEWKSLSNPVKVGLTTCRLFFINKLHVVIFNNVNNVSAFFIINFSFWPFLTT